MSAPTITLSQLQRQTIIGTATGPDGNTYRLSTHAVGPARDQPVSGDNTISRATYYGTKSGWYLNMPSSGERVVADASIRAGRVVLTSLIPDLSSPCSFGGTGWVMEFDTITGDRLDTTTFDTNADGNVNSTDYLAFPSSGTGTNNTSGRMIGAIPAAPAFMGMPPPGAGGGANGGVQTEVKQINLSNGTLTTVVETGPPRSTGRVMWREVR